ncbi:MAG: hypothetical protein Q7R60_00050 [bacterium]|nr:hypothetical protein [bacterium]
MRYCKTLLAVLLLTLFLVGSTSLVQAAAASPPSEPLAEPPTITNFNEFIQTNRSGGLLFNFMVAAGYTMAIVGIVYAGVLYLSAFGSEERPALAKKAIIAVITGLVIIVLSRVIVASIVPTDDTGALKGTSIIDEGLQ